jgi:replicative DNA helicase
MKLESKDLETMLIAYLLYNPNFITIANEYLTSKDLFHTLPISVFKTFEISKSPQKLTMFEISELIKVKFDILADIMLKVVAPREIEFRSICKTIKHYSNKRLYKNLQNEIDKKLECGDDLTEIQEDYLRFFNSIENIDENILSSEELGQIAYNEYIENVTSQKRYMPIGYSAYDSLHGGFVKNDYIILAARTSIGKSSLAISICYNMIKTGTRVAYLTLEMTTVSILNKFISIHTNTDLYKIINPKPYYNIENYIVEGCNFIKESNLIVEAARGKTDLFVKSKIKKYANMGYNLVVIDLIDKIRCSERIDKRNYQLGHISRTLFDASKEYDIAVIAVVQLNREASKGEKPALNHIKDSGDLEQDADVVMLLARPEQTGESQFWDKTDAVGKARLIKAKDRMGGTGYITLGFNKETTYFYDLEMENYTSDRF